MERELLNLIESYPQTVKWRDIVDFENFAERLSAVDFLVANTIGVSDGFIEFIPDNSPPLEEEILCWIWVIRPDLSKEILTLDISDDFQILMNSYIDSNMEEFWNHIS